MGAPLGSALLQVLARVLARFFDRYERTPTRQQSRMLAMLTIVMAFLSVPIDLARCDEVIQQLDVLTDGAHAFMTVVRDLPTYRSYLIPGGMQRVEALDHESRSIFQQTLAAYYERNPHLKAALMTLPGNTATTS